MQPFGRATREVRYVDPPFFAGRAFDPETISVMSVAFESACEGLGLHAACDDPATRLVAGKVIELVQRGVHDPEQLRSVIVREFTT